MNGYGQTGTGSKNSFECHASYRMARTAADRDEVYQLRHEAYRRDEAIDPQPGNRFFDHFDSLPNNFSFLACRRYKGTEATVRISVVRPDLGWHEAPSRRVFAGHPELEAMAMESYVEASRLCFGPLAQRDAFLKLVGYMAALADVFETGWLVACPRREHTKTYESLFGFRTLAEPRQYFGVRFQTQLLGVRREEIRQHVASNRHMLLAWREALEHLQGVSVGGVGIAMASGAVLGESPASMRDAN